VISVSSVVNSFDTTTDPFFVRLAPGAFATDAESGW